jgi:hypothetical protein
MNTQASIIRGLIGAFAFFVALSPQARATAVHASQPELAAVAHSLPLGGKLEVQGLSFIEGSTVILNLQRFQVFTPDAKIVINDQIVLPIPDIAYYRGTVEGKPDAVAVLAVPASGTPEGIVFGGQNGIWKIGGQAALSARKLSEEELAPLKEFRCGADKAELDLRQHHLPESSKATVNTAASFSYIVKVAVETDYEFYSLFNNETAATSYVGALFAYVSSIYQNEIGTSLQVSYLRFWSNGASSDPWTATSGTSAALDELQAYWKANMSSVSRTITHMLSGKSLGGGIAYLGVLCNSSYGYGVSASLSRTTVNTSSTVWDSLVVAHEIGHNFGSPHTHGYCNVGGNANPVDLCSAGEYDCSGMAASGLPGVGSLTGGTAGTGNGTIMSYCHSLSPGYSNITMTFGTSHPYGIAANRVPQTMIAEVQSSFQSYPGCIDIPLLTVSKSGTGSGIVTSSPAGIDCGSTCSASFAGGEKVTLTATADSGSLFIGWSGACSGTNTSCEVTMDAVRSVNARFWLENTPQPFWLPAVNMLLTH